MGGDLWGTFQRTAQLSFNDDSHIVDYYSVGKGVGLCEAFAVGKFDKCVAFGDGGHWVVGGDGC